MSRGAWNPHRQIIVLVDQLLSGSLRNLCPPPRDKAGTCEGLDPTGNREDKTRELPPGIMRSRIKKKTKPEPEGRKALLSGHPLAFQWKEGAWQGLSVEGGRHWGLLPIPAHSPLLLPARAGLDFPDVARREPQASWPPPGTAAFQAPSSVIYKIIHKNRTRGWHRQQVVTKVALFIKLLGIHLPSPPSVYCSTPAGCEPGGPADTGWPTALAWV